MRLLSYQLICLFITGIATTSFGQHADVAVYRDATGRISAHDSSGGQIETRVFRRSFDFWGPPLGIYAGDDPGFQMSGLNPPNGYTALPAGRELQLNLVPLHIPGQGIGNVLFWDGVSTDVEFTSMPPNHVLFVEDATGLTEVELTGGNERFDALVAGFTNSSGGLHEHLTFAVENAGQAPTAGFYLMGWQLAMEGWQSSKTLLVALNPSSLPGAIQSQVTSWLVTQASLIQMAGDFDGSGDYAIDDVDQLVSAIAGSTHPEAFDLTTDGLVDSVDLDVWRQLAGRVLNTSQAPVLIGDANLDGTVDGQDFIAWNNNKFTAAAGWSGGDFSADGVVDGQDFIAWNNNKFLSADRAVAVPELSAFGILFLFVPWLYGIERRLAHVSFHLAD